MFQVEDINKSFKTDFWKKEFVALKNVTFKINQSSITGFLGANGAGKTTLLKILLGFISADSGKIIFDEKLKTKKSYFENIGYMPERPYYYTNLTGREFLHFCAKLSGISKNDTLLQIEKWTQRLEISYALDRKIQSYSKGMLQRLGFASTLLHRPQLLILDEPLSGLDPIGRRDFKNILLELNKDGRTIFFSSHIVSDIEEICREAVVLDKGQMIYNGNIASLLKTSEDSFVEIIVTSNEQIMSQYKPYFKFEVSEGAVFKIPRQLEQKFLKDIITNDLEIISLKQSRKNLEEVIYSFKEI